MTKQEFLEGLRKYLSGSLDYRKVNEHLKYYTEYIDGQIRMGRTQEEVLQELGDPRLIAKTLTEMGEVETQGETIREDFIDEEETGNQRRFRMNWNQRSLNLPSWVVSILTAVIVFFVFTLVMTFFVGVIRFLPLILIGIILYRLVRNFL